MSKKRKLESLQQLGLLKTTEIKAVQHALARPQVVPTYVTKATVRWSSLAVVVGLSYASLAMVIGLAWKLSH